MKFKFIWRASPNGYPTTSQKQEELRTLARRLWQSEQVKHAENGSKAMSVASLLGESVCDGERFATIVSLPRRLEIALEEQPVLDKQTKWLRKLLLTSFLGWEGLPETFPVCLESLPALEQLKSWAKTWDTSWYGRGNGLCGEARITDTFLHKAYWIRAFDHQRKPYVEGDREFLSAFASWLLFIQATFQDEDVQFIAKRDATRILQTLDTLEHEDPLWYSHGYPRIDHQQDAFELALSFSRIAADLAPGYWVTLALWLSHYLSEHERPLSWKDISSCFV